MAKQARPHKLMLRLSDEELWRLEAQVERFSGPLRFNRCDILRFALAELARSDKWRSDGLPTDLNTNFRDTGLRVPYVIKPPEGK